MIRLDVPSKTFLVGEYAVLQGAPALVAATKPFFRFSAEFTEQEQESIFHPESPAGRWYHQSRVLLRNQKIQCDDPHAGRGGFGASGAQFVFLHALCTYLQSKRLEDDVADVWNDFRVCSGNGSGADVVAQTLGGIAHFTMNPFEARSYDWPFDETDFFVVPTGQKLETHTHLKTLKIPPAETLLRADVRTVDAFFIGNVEAFVAGLQDFQSELAKLDLQAPQTTELLERINAFPGVLGSKGCGAMGADTVFILVDREFQSEFLQAMDAAKLQPIASNRDLAARPALRVD